MLDAASYGLLALFRSKGVEFLVVGGHAVETSGRLVACRTLADAEFLERLSG
jgi:hypothetical protein